MTEKALEQAVAALKELVAQTENRFFGIKHDHFALQDARAAIRRGQEALAEQPVHWGVDWSKDGSCVSIIKRLPDGGIEVVAVEYSTLFKEQP